MKSFQSLLSFAENFWKIFERRTPIRIPQPNLSEERIIKHKIRQPQPLHLQGVAAK